MAAKKILERDIEAKVVKWAKAKGVHVKKKHWADTLDRWFFGNRGKLVIIEFKVPGKRPTPLQQQEINSLRNRGFHAVWSDDANLAIEFLEGRPVFIDQSGKLSSI